MVRPVLTGTASAEELAELVLAPIADLTRNRRTAVLETLLAFLDCGTANGRLALHIAVKATQLRPETSRQRAGRP